MVALPVIQNGIYVLEQDEKEMREGEKEMREDV